MAASEPPDYVPLERIAPAHLASVWSVALTTMANGRAVLASCGDNVVQLWDPTTGDPWAEPLRGHTAPVRCVAFARLSNGRTLLASGSDDRTVRLWTLDPDSGVRPGDPFSVEGVVRSVAFGTLPDGRTLLASSDDRIVRLWDLSTGTAFGDALIGHGMPVTSVARKPGDSTRILYAAAGRLAAT